MDKLQIGKDYIGVGVGAVIIRNNQVLLLLRNKPPEANSWTIIGGKVEFGETIEKAILREVKEEIGCSGKLIAYLGITNHILPEEGTHFVSPRFLVEISEQPINMELESHSDMKWFNINELPVNITKTTEIALRAFLAWKKGMNPFEV